MSKWLNTVVTTLSILALTSLVGALLKGPIDNLANGSRLNAHVELAPWIDKELFQKASEKIEDRPKSSDEILDDLLIDLQTSHYIDGDDFGVARFSIENDSSNTVKEVNFRLDKPYGKLQTFVVDANGKILDLGEVERVKLPDFSPGDRITVYIWGNFSEYLMPQKLKTYSSEGEFRTTFSWPEAQEFQYESGIGELLDDYAWISFIILTSFLAIIFGIVCNIQDEYIKKIYGDADFLEDEKDRFISDPKNFVPQFLRKSVKGPAPSKGGREAETLKPQDGKQ